MLNDDNQFQMKNLMNYFVEDDHKIETHENSNENLEESRPFIPQKAQSSKQKFQSILIESAFKEISNIGNSLKDGMKNESSVKCEPATLQRNIFSNIKKYGKRQNFSETFKCIEQTWNTIISKPQKSISRSFSLKNFVISFFFIFNLLFFIFIK